MKKIFIAIILLIVVVVNSGVLNHALKLLPGRVSTPSPEAKQDTADKSGRSLLI